ncbi:DUF975 family protein [uncultured Holdemanella sp.]|jgi:uncharacterized membrane protein|uniref:DUF975 family protein n=1 Tax=uncultured Holdemanella sp. TaxID=1763549 RepID=UPI0025DDF286|nr:DUF975 family protein [uncultured Holdemanella sp.]
MWNRQQVKEQAKIIMKRNYWKMFVVTLLVGLLTGEKTTIIERVQNFASTNISYDTSPIFYSSNFQYIFYSFISIASILGILYTIFIGNVIVVGKSRYFIKNHDENPELSEIFKGFKGNYLNVVKIMFLMNLKILLWLFLFIVPGIIKAYEYSMIPYLLAENPNLSASQAFSLSKQMTTGQKMDLFVLDLSFLGWIILGLICCGIGILFLQPYPEATRAEVYLILKQQV